MNIRSILSTTATIVRRFPLAAAAVTGVAGIAIGGAALASPAPAPIVQKGEVRTVTSIVEKPVEKTVTKTVEKTPQGCLDVVTEARKLFGYSGDVAGIAADNATISGEGSQITLGVLEGWRTDDPSVLPGLTKRTQALTARTRANTAKINAINGDVATAMVRFNAAAAACAQSRP